MSLIEKIKTKKANIGIIGLGYVGLPLAIEFCKVGFPVTGFDLDQEKINCLKKGKSYIRHVDATPIAKKGNAVGTFIPTGDFTKLLKADCIVICVPTPLNKYREPDLSYVFNTTRTIAKYLRKGQLIVLESTTYPGTTNQDMGRFWRRPDLGPEPISIWLSPRNARTRTIRIFPQAPSQRWWADLRRHAWKRPRRYTIPLLRQCLCLPQK